MLEKIRTLNPDYQIHELDDSFKEYGRIIKQDMQEAIDYATTYQNTNAYDTSVQVLEEMPCIQDLINDIYGYLDVMAGVVTGKNEVLNGLEYHQCSETIIAVTDYILALGKRQDMEGNDYDIEKCVLFYVPKGTVVELYATTLHYTPITVKDSFKTICLLLRGTGDSCQRRGILKKKNKWFIAHKDNVEKVQAGDYPGLKGKMIRIKYL